MKPPRTAGTAEQSENRTGGREAETETLEVSQRGRGGRGTCLGMYESLRV